MKKLAIAILLAYSSVSMADNIYIYCPTSDYYTFEGKSWKLMLESKDRYSANDRNDGVKKVRQFHLYNPVTKVLEQSTPELTFDSIKFNFITGYIRYGNSNQMTLVCEGEYMGQSVTPGIIFDKWLLDKQDSVIAELPLSSSYKNCEPIQGNAIFYCTK